MGIESSHGILFTHSCALSGSSTDRPLETPHLAISRRPTSPSESVGANLAVILVRSYGGSGNGNMNYFPAFGDDIVVAIDSDIMNEAGLLLRMRLVYCFRGKVNAFLKKAYLGGCCYQRRTGHQVCHPVHLRVGDTNLNSIFRMGDRLFALEYLQGRLLSVLRIWSG
ncbi:hypothetical protein CY34DRAFT_685869 [Suillus luteus UH-Slu-Lm8-n1]|uniref:Uncharacterized protein n=1 Tax=Suillus luteus UH-Slu-Lm8-n1 TaxID=930992 RepID=A0A0D0BBU9_9AGAM|nr:hypothetical protein CY34DRAFT_685869 [Suillus luteus UH-Slu-Lm8-n1]